MIIDRNNNMEYIDRGSKIWLFS